LPSGIADTILLGGFIRSDKGKTRSGVPLLMDIPLLGDLFTYRGDKKDRSEMVVMIRPTVLKTPELAAAQAVKEEQRLPGISPPPRQMPLMNGEWLKPSARPN